MCAAQGPIEINNQLSYGFAAANLGPESAQCCACYALTFTSGHVAGKKMVVQVTNTGADLAHNQFDIAIPGGGQGIFSGCARQYPGYAGGKQYGGVTKAGECHKLPPAMQAGCQWRFGDWWRNADNPQVLFHETNCPIELTTISGCQRKSA